MVDVPILKHLYTEEPSEVHGNGGLEGDIGLVPAASVVPVVLANHWSPVDRMPIVLIVLEDMVPTYFPIPGPSSLAIYLRSCCQITFRRHQLAFQGQAVAAAQEEVRNMFVVDEDSWLGYSQQDLHRNLMWEQSLAMRMAWEGEPEAVGCFLSDPAKGD